jgi:formiminotetrahydrofolate cyclodeaminase
VVAARGAARPEAIAKAIDVPLHVMRLSADALQIASGVAARCHRPAASDVRVAIELLRAGFAGARSSVLANLGGVNDDRHRDNLRAEVDRLSNEAGVAAASAGAEC